MSFFFHKLALFRLLSLLVLLETTVWGLQPQAPKDSRSLSRQLESLSTAKQAYEQVRALATNEVTKRFDQLIEEVEKSGADIDLRTIAIDDLKDAKEEFKEEGVFRKIPIMQGAYSDFIFATRGSHQKLMKVYDKTLRMLPRDDKRTGELKSEIKTYSDLINRNDSLKEGQRWVGFRSDHNWGGGLKLKSNPLGGLYLRHENNGTAQVDFSFTVIKRVGQEFEGKITQSGGQFEALVRGSYDGVNVSMRMVKMIRGDTRYFEYSGILLGNFGRLDLAGIKTNGFATTGTITLETD